MCTLAIYLCLVLLYSLNLFLIFLRIAFHKVYFLDLHYLMFVQICNYILTSFVFLRDRFCY